MPDEKRTHASVLRMQSLELECRVNGNSILHSELNSALCTLSIRSRELPAAALRFTTLGSRFDFAPTFNRNPPPPRDSPAPSEKSAVALNRSTSQRETVAPAHRCAPGTGPCRSAFATWRRENWRTS